MSTEKQRFDRRLRERVYLREQGKSEEEIDQRMRDNPTFREENEAHRWMRRGRNLDSLSSGQRKMLERHREQEEYFKQTRLEREQLKQEQLKPVEVEDNVKQLRDEILTALSNELPFAEQEQLKQEQLKQEQYRLKAKATGWTNNLSDYEQQVLIRLDMLIADVGHHEIPPRYKPYSGGGQKRYRKKRTKKKTRRRKKMRRKKNRKRRTKKKSRRKKR